MRDEMRDRSRTRLERAALSAAAAALLILGAGSALAAFTRLGNLTHAGRDAVNPQVATDGAGNAIAVWERSDGTSFRLQARRLPAAAPPAPAQTLSPSGHDAFSPGVAADASGDAIAVWVRSDGTDLRIEARQLPAAGAPGPVLSLSPSGHDAASPTVAIDADGDAIVTWYRSDGTNDRIEARQVSAAGALGPVLTLSDGGQNATAPEVASDADGNALVAWYRFDGTNWRIQARAVTGAGAVGPVQTLSAAGKDGYAPEVAQDAAGDAIVAWTRYTSSSGYRVLARQLPAGGVFGGVQKLSKPGGHTPEVATDADGDAIVAWGAFDGAHDRIKARQVSAAGVLGPALTLSAGGQDAFGQQVSTGDTGNAVVTWVRLDGSNSRVQARTISSSAVLGPTETLSKRGQDAVGPAIASDASGDAIVLWQRFDGANARIQGAVGP